ncbi:hypothetical protein [uncultured Jannaschia sp.]|uniref:hypothetical protein n=1 Tax=uncultured Jannaschia sp. TaxID=293347 RepID=UPI002637BFF3|nr:hypothetical protein [uncultured Jannaschia sp.]
MDDNRIRPIGTLESAATSAGVAALAGAGTFALLMLIADWSFLQAVFGGFVVAAVVFCILLLTIARPVSRPVGAGGVQRPTADLAQAEAPGTPGEPARPLAPRDVNAPSPHKASIDSSMISDVRRDGIGDPRVNRALGDPSHAVGLAGTGHATPMPAPAPVDADPVVAKPAAATTAPKPQAQPAPLDGEVVSPEPPKAAPPKPAAPAKPAAATSSASAAPDAGAEGTKPETLDAPRGGAADDLKRIKGIGPKLETLCNRLGFWHFDQVASWSDEEIAWVDANLEGFKGRVRRDDWVAQAKLLAEGGDTAFSKRVDKGGVY